MSDEDDPPLMPTLEMQITRAVTATTEIVLKLQAQNLILTTALAHLIVHVSISDPDPRAAAIDLTRVAKAIADAKLEDLHADPATIDGAHDAHTLLLDLTTMLADVAVKQKRAARRWWLPGTWGW